MRILSSQALSKWKELAKRPELDSSALDASVSEILSKVKEGGDASLVELTEKFDGVKLASVQLSATEIQTAANSVKPDLKSAILAAKANIEKFHKAQAVETLRVETTPGVICSRESRAISKVGLYVPGGSAPLFSTVLMLGVPAKLAGCEEIILCSPAPVAPEIVFTASILGIEKIYSIGGAQAIAAMAYGTETVAKVEKIFGPGNQYVTAAKQLLSRSEVAIDMPAGPSEVLVIADDEADPAFVAADLLSQAEHGPDSQVVLTCLSEQFAKQVAREIEIQLSSLPRGEIAKGALENSFAVVFSNTEECIEFSNFYAPEHLIIQTRDYKTLAGQVQNAGSVFLGDYTPESCGDYASGTNHTLPTGGWARSYSGVSLDSFTKKITFQEISSEGLKALGPIVETMASAEQLDAHKNAVGIRLKKESS